MIRVFQGFTTTEVITKSSTRRGIPTAPLASLGSSATDDPLPRRVDSSSTKKRKRKKV